MPTIKGPIEIKPGKPIPTEIAKHIKLPFQADNFKSTKMPKGIVIEPVSKAEVSRKYTEAELFKLNREEQVRLIKKLSGGTAKIPRYEKDRVKLILELQGSD